MKSIKITIELDIRESQDLISDLKKASVSKWNTQHVLKLIKMAESMVLSFEIFSSDYSAYVSVLEQVDTKSTQALIDYLP